MYVTAEVSLYPLQEEFLPSILAFVASIKSSPGLFNLSKLNEEVEKIN